MAKLKNSKDLIMLLLHVPGATGEENEPIAGQTRLMKMIFLFDKEIRPRFGKDAFEDMAFPEFEAYDYGPYAPKVYSDLEWLVNMGFVSAEDRNLSEVADEERKEFDYWTATGSADDELDLSRLGRRFRLTELGARFVGKMLPTWEFSVDQLKTLQEFKSRCVSASLKALLHYTYTRYPETTTKSKIRKEVLGS